MILKVSIKKVKIKSTEEALKQRSCIITGIMSLRHLKTEFFRLKMDFKKKSHV